MDKNTFDQFTVWFTDEKVFLDGAAFPLGQHRNISTQFGI